MLLDLVGRGFQDDLILQMLEQAVRVLPESAVVRTPGGLDVGHAPRFRPEDAEEGFWMRRPRPDLEIEWLLQQAPVRGPEGREFENEILKRQSGEQSVDQA